MYLGDSTSKIKPSIVMAPAEMGSVVEHYMKQLHGVIGELAFQSFERRGCQHGHALDDWLQAEQRLLQQAPVEIAETDSELILSLQVQVSEYVNLEVIVGASELVVTGIKPPSEQMSEPSPELVRFIALPCSIVPNKASVRLHEDGFFEIILPKAAPQAITDTQCGEDACVASET